MTGGDEGGLTREKKHLRIKAFESAANRKEDTSSEK